MHPIVKVWPLPKLSEEILHQLFVLIVTHLTSLEGVRGENDVMVAFPQDLMLYGTGTEVCVEMEVDEGLRPDIRQEAVTVCRNMGFDIQRFLQKYMGPAIPVHCKISFKGTSFKF